MYQINTYVFSDYKLNMLNCLIGHLDASFASLPTFESYGYFMGDYFIIILWIWLDLIAFGSIQFGLT